MKRYIWQANGWWIISDRYPSNVPMDDVNEFDPTEIGLEAFQPGVYPWNHQFMARRIA